MLFLLTGDVQIGKTRWLERLASELYAEGCEVAGVVAPACGARRGRAGSRSSASTTCCCRTASASRSRGGATSRAPRGLLDPESQSEAAQLAWHISDDALARVNAHFGLIAEGMCGGAEEGEARPRLLVVDELGRLELERGCASYTYIYLLARGATARFPHALAVVRDWLLPRAVERFGAAWGGARAISPDDGARGLVRAACDLAS